MTLKYKITNNRLDYFFTILDPKYVITSSAKALKSYTSGLMVIFFLLRIYYFF